MASVVSDQLIVKLMKQGLGQTKIAKRLGIGLCSKRMQRLRAENGIAKLQTARAPVSDEILEPLLIKGFGRKKIKAIIGREISNQRLSKIRDRLGLVTRRPSRHLPEAELRSLIMQGLRREDIIKRLGVNVDWKRIGRICSALGLPRNLRFSRAPRDEVCDGLLRDIRAALSHVRDTSIRDDAMSEMYLAALEGRLDVKDIGSAARKFSGAEVGRWQSRFGPVSIDEVRSTDDDWSLSELIADDSALEAFDEIKFSHELECD